MKRQTVQFLHSEALPSSRWSTPNHPREMLNLEKNHIVESNFLVVISRSRKQNTNSWVSQLPMLGFTHSCLPWAPRILQSCSSRQTIPSASVPWKPGAARPASGEAAEFPPQRCQLQQLPWTRALCCQQQQRWISLELIA